MAPCLPQLAGSDRAPSAARSCPQDCTVAWRVWGHQRACVLRLGWGQQLPCWALSQAPPSVLPAAGRGRIFLRACLYTKNPRLRVVKTQAQRGTGFQPTLFRSAEHALRAHVHTSLRALRPAACSSGWGCSEGRAPAQCGPWGCWEGRAPAQCGPWLWPLFVDESEPRPEEGGF